MESLLWERVGELGDRAPRISDLTHHKLHLIAASRARERGQEVPPELRIAELHHAAFSLSAEPLLRRVRATTDAQILLMKGPEAAAWWPKPKLRPWKDLDVLVQDAETVQAALVDAGFAELGGAEEYRNLHHAPPLVLPGMPLALEVHRRPHWPSNKPPRFEELMEAAAPAGFAVPGIFAPSPAHHAVLLAGHAWGHEPLSRIGMLADIAALAAAGGWEDVDTIARGWGVARLWSTTARAIDQLLLSPKRKARPPVWHRHLYDARERTVFEDHVQRLIGAVAAAPVSAAPLVATRAVFRTLRPSPGERWGEKLDRSRLSARNASLRGSEHNEQLVGRSTP